jgi:catechol 2,3-dioxygenase-like lactoylglutathione lyase family enzyme
MLKFGDVAVVVKNAKRSAKWYREKLGFRIQAQDGHWVAVLPKGANVPLHLCEGNRPEKGNTGIGFVVKSVPRSARALRAKGVRFTQPPTETEWGTYAMFADPDGNEFWLSES